MRLFGRSSQCLRLALRFCACHRTCGALYPNCRCWYPLWKPYWRCFSGNLCSLCRHRLCESFGRGLADASSSCCLRSFGGGSYVAISCAHRPMVACSHASRMKGHQSYSPHRLTIAFDRMCCSSASMAFECSDFAMMRTSPFAGKGSLTPAFCEIVKCPLTYLNAYDCLKNRWAGCSF